MMNTRSLTLIVITLATGVMRLIPHPPNFTPIGAIALFGGAQFAGIGTALLTPLSAMVLSDLLLGFGFHSVMPFVYGSFVLIVCLGRWIGRRPTPLAVAGGTVSASLVFFVVTNFGVWLVGHLYPLTLRGLLVCYVAAIPFFENTLAGDAFYTALLFGGFALAQRQYGALREAPGGTRASFGTAS